MVELPIPKETFVNADEKTYRSLEYDMLSHILNCNETCRTDHDKILVEHAAEIKKIKNRRHIDTGVSAGSGVLGGFLAMIAKIFFWNG